MSRAENTSMRLPAGSSNVQPEVFFIRFPRTRDE
jgi:hypothetical protein